MEAFTTFVQAVGIPAAFAFVLLWILWRLGNRIVDKHVATAERTMVVLEQLPAAMATLCKASCPLQQPAAQRPERYRDASVSPPVILPIQGTSP